MIGGTEYLSATDPNTSLDPDSSFALPNHLPAFPLNTIIPLPGKELYDLSRKLTPHIAYYLPRNTDPAELADWADDVSPSGGIEAESEGAMKKQLVEVEEEWMGWAENPFAEEKYASGRRKKRGSVKVRGDQAKLKAITAYYGDLADPGLRAGEGE